MGIQCIYIKTMFSLKRHKQRVSPGKQKAWTKKFNIPYKWKHRTQTNIFQVEGRPLQTFASCLFNIMLTISLLF